MKRARLSSPTGARVRRKNDSTQRGSTAPLACIRTSRTRPCSSKKTIATARPSPVKQRAKRGAGSRRRRCRWSSSGASMRTRIAFGSGLAVSRSPGGSPGIGVESRCTSARSTKRRPAKRTTSSTRWNWAIAETCTRTLPVPDATKRRPSATCPRPNSCGTTRGRSPSQMRARVTRTRVSRSTRYMSVTSVTQLPSPGLEELALKERWTPS